MRHTPDTYPDGRGLPQQLEPEGLPLLSHRVASFLVDHEEMPYSLGKTFH